ncbi:MULTISPECIES: hypothetical protein [Nitrosomonas]|uniref:CDP-Glycerol:Poly(Glycerophosphate) glycerophosphotransferase n=1 Tax=Nitrosomonas communis TaxID=44574 RepID=A0A0F7KJ65_9PROT|nr:MULTISPECIES: hypothetical protein [Nitrosomonas]AKH38949.1 hypothetical protein AAW31_15900 [Nitrosomonas communis]TYP82100.1 hypothetical protein BCL69_104610 [Nitrosomonas communis]UVS61098.1 hypothetical protein NX761_16670 [Nitrosomonas sp. PLL12]SDV99415.1 hypothetical protein SAMN05421882_100153 [Nitrosomonas communis]
MKALFFLRHYNDIDHITPVISKWIDAGHTCDVILIGAKRFRYDFRISFLSQLSGVRVAHIREIFSTVQFLKWRLQMLLLTGNLRRLFIGPFIRWLADSYDAKRRAPLWRATAEHLLTRSFEHSNKGVIAFDWIERNSVIAVEWVETVVAMARERGLGTVSLPHGDSPHANQLIRRGEWHVGPDSLFSTAQIFDKLVVPNELCAKRFRPFLEERSIAILGSPRYSEEWLAKLAKLMPLSPLTRSDSRLKIVMFLRKANFTTFWEEVNEVVHLIAAFPGVELAIKPHTRSGWKQSLTKNKTLKQLPNVTIAGDEVHSIHLMNWADICIDLATSVVFEAVRVKKPVLAADYLHAGRSAIAVYMPETELRCRDDVYEKINNFLSHGCHDFYIEEHRQHFLREMLDVSGPEVLSRYVALLETAAGRH